MSANIRELLMKGLGSQHQHRQFLLGILVGRDVEFAWHRSRECRLLQSSRDGSARESGLSIFAP
jgi:hypothetical protein